MYGLFVIDRFYIGFLETMAVIVTFTKAPQNKIMQFEKLKMFTKRHQAVEQLVIYHTQLLI